MVNGNNAVSPRVPFSSSAAIDHGATLLASASTADPPNHVSPYLVSAPPPLLKDSPSSRSHGRERAVSAVSSIGMSTDMHGGHIPFTHHLPMVPQEADEEQDHYDEVSSQTHSRILDVAQPVRDSLLWEHETNKKKKKKKNFIHFGRQKGLVKEKEHHWRAADWHSEEHAREREAREREDEMRRIEWEKRQEEIMQGAAVSRLTPHILFFPLFAYPFFFSQKKDTAPSPKSQPIHMPNVSPIGPVPTSVHTTSTFMIVLKTRHVSISPRCFAG